ncbi:uncharacterized protein F4807DRAFT_424434 [Annulohypoxylon truncatum]|uniref:uncharacterized protein n=1 Tax=Annulohypoxylon truncatum TaxID=327061 RepID=UPI0020085783|nr:uncharacterized protein F4807DRAFT_424434 [Annulohypoxylon truncatum]KAI1210250.1 hypothetical protein F4807DRAFT_424434 [Annulohypoxylon truncatum]
MKFLLCHQAPLRRLYLRNVSLKNISWVPLLAQIRKELYLTGPCICGTLMGRSEKDDRLFYYCKKRRHSKMNRYIERGGKAYPDMTVCPLKERNETK